jgi:hypothetical protein
VTPQTAATDRQSDRSLYGKMEVEDVVDGVRCGGSSSPVNAA